ncbi:MAG: hypothetical protein H0V16_12330 [Burkholderiaceae bacterium]|nr:hypothetical protein [Burkholderiaceae bacterium]
MRLIAKFLACLIPVAAVNAADIERRCNSESSACIIDFSGEIVTGDAERMAQILIEPLPAAKSHISSLEIDSLGGDVVEALRIGELVRLNMLNVSIARIARGDPGAQPLRRGAGSDRVCASACVLVLMSAPARSVREARVGLHRPRLSAEFYRQQSPSSIARAHAELDRKVRDTVIAGGMPTDLVERMMRHASNELLWLASGELASLDSEAPWYQEMQIALCGATVRSERVSAAFQSWQEESSEAPRSDATDASCGVGITTREQAKFRAARPLIAAKQGGSKRVLAVVPKAPTLPSGAVSAR